MEKIYKLVFLLFLIFSINQSVIAQCPWPAGISLYGTATAGTTCSPVQAQSSGDGCHFLNEYASFTGLTIGNTYSMQVTNTTTTTLPPYELAVYNSNTTGSAPIAFASSPTFPFSVTFVASATTVYTKAYRSGCNSASTTQCTYYNLTCTSCPSPVPITVQPSVATIPQGAVEAQVLRIDVPICFVTDATSITLNTSGSTNPATDITGARLYYTTTSTFATTTLFGTAVSNPNGSFTFTGNQPLLFVTGYFWLVYDISPTAVIGNVVDAALTSMVVGGSTLIPATANPTGSRTIVAAIANDNCVGAIAFPPVPLNGTCSSVNVNTAGASGSLDATCGGAEDDDLWYSFTVPIGYTSINYANTNISGNTDRSHQLFTSCGGTSLGCFDAEAGTFTGLTGGTTYIIRTNTYGSAVVTNFTLCLTVPPPPPANDDCSGAVTLTPAANTTCAGVTPGTTISSTASSTTPLPTCGTANDDVWYKFTATFPSHIVTLSNVVGGVTDMAFTVYSSTTNDCSGTFTQLVCSDPNTTNVTGLTVGNVYFVRVYTYTATVGSTASFDICITSPAPCANPTGLTATGITSNSAILNWTENGQGTSWDIEIAISPYVFTGTPTYTGVTKPYIVMGLNPSTGYQFRVRASSCPANWSASSSTFTTLGAPPVNEEATSAIALTVGAGCTGAIYTNVNSTPTSVSATEPRNTGGDAFKTVWFTFVAPASGAVRVSTDVGSGNTLTDSRVAIYSATNPANYATFTVISGDEDGGSVLGSGFMSVAFATGLTPGGTYYIQVGTFSAATTSGTFCIAIDELNSSMLATTATCTLTPQTVFGVNPSYTGWIPILDATSKLIALVRNPTGVSPETFLSAGLDQNINVGPVRQDAQGKYYLDRNYALKSATAGPYNVQLFFLQSERTALAGVDPLAATLANLNVTRDPAVNCKTFPTGVDNQILMQTGNGSIGGAEWVAFTTPSFSGFFIHTGLVALPVTIVSFNAKAVNEKSVNLTWNVADEINVKEYIVERSNDNSNWLAIGSVSANQKPSYAFTDNNPLKGINYYRLAVKDINSSVAFSQVRSVNFSGRAGLALYPNPANSQVFISGSLDKNVVVSVYNEVGQIVQTLKMSGDNLSSQGIDISVLLPGAYSIQIKGESGVNTMRFVKN